MLLHTVGASNKTFNIKSKLAGYSVGLPVTDARYFRIPRLLPLKPPHYLYQNTESR